MTLVQWRWICLIFWLHWCIVCQHQRSLFVESIMLPFIVAFLFCSQRQRTGFINMSIYQHVSSKSRLMCYATVNRWGYFGLNKGQIYLRLCSASTYCTTCTCFCWVFAKCQQVGLIVTCMSLWPVNFSYFSTCEIVAFGHCIPNWPHNHVFVVLCLIHRSIQIALTFLFKAFHLIKLLSAF